MQNTEKSVKIDLNERNNIYVAKSLRISIINWGTVFLIYLPYVFYALVIILVGMICWKLQEADIHVKDIMAALYRTQYHLLNLGWMGLALLGVCFCLIMRRSRPTYLIDFACFEPPDDWKLSRKEILELMRRQGVFTEESLSFMSRILDKSGTSDSTAWPPGITRCLKGDDVPADRSVHAAREEAKTVIFTCVENALRKAGKKASEIDILIVNCSLFSPTPSLCSLISNKFKMGAGVKTYNLSGMGCSAGVVAIDLAKQLLQATPRMTALVVSTENLTQNLYLGNERPMLLQNTLFRVGGVAVVLSNKWQDGFRAKYKLLHTVRVQNSSSKGLHCVYEQEDSFSVRGVVLSKDIVQIAGEALQANLTLLGPLILSIREQAKCLVVIATRRVCEAIRQLLLVYGDKETANKIPRVDHYVPNFKRSLDHFCIHAGGRAVIDGIQKNLSLSQVDVEPSRDTLYNYGNTSSSSIWYELKFIEEKGRAQRGHRVLQVAFGSGFKCNSAVWLRL